MVPFIALGLFSFAGRSAGVLYPINPHIPFEVSQWSINKGLIPNGPFENNADLSVMSLKTI